MNYPTAGTLYKGVFIGNHVNSQESSASRKKPRSEQAGSSRIPSVRIMGRFYFFLANARMAKPYASSNFSSKKNAHLLGESAIPELVRE